jgi:hypothetical protein
MNSVVFRSFCNAAFLIQPCFSFAKAQPKEARPSPAFLRLALSLANGGLLLHDHDPVEALFGRSHGVVLRGSVTGGGHIARGIIPD